MMSGQSAAAARRIQMQCVTLTSMDRIIITRAYGQISMHGVKSEKTSSLRPKKFFAA